MHKKLIFSTLLFSSLSAPTIVFGMNIDTILKDKSELRVGIVDNTGLATWYNNKGEIAGSTKKIPTTYSCEIRLEQNKNSNILHITQSKSRFPLNLSLDLSNVNPKIIEVMQSIDTKNQKLIIRHSPYTEHTSNPTIYMQQSS